MLVEYGACSYIGDIVFVNVVRAVDCQAVVPFKLECYFTLSSHVVFACCDDGVDEVPNDRQRGTSRFPCGGSFDWCCTKDCF